MGRQIPARNRVARGPVRTLEQGAARLEQQATAETFLVPARKNLVEFVWAPRGWCAQPSLRMQAQPRNSPRHRQRLGVGSKLAKTKPQFERQLPPFPARSAAETGNAAQHRLGS